jgi:hypothetical protein
VNRHLFGVVSPEFQKLLIRDSEGIVAAILSLMASSEPTEFDPLLNRLRAAPDQFRERSLCQAIADPGALFGEASQSLPNCRDRAIQSFCDQPNILAAGKVNQTLFFNRSPLSWRSRPLLSQP